MEARAGADLAAAAQIAVVGPQYEPVDVQATLVVVDPSQAGVVQHAAHDAIAGFLHPLRGGPEGKGFQPGAELWVSDLAVVVERTAGVDRARDLGYLKRGVAQGQRLEIGAGRLPVAGDIRLKLVES